MIQRRYSHGICYINEYLYVVGGKNGINNSLKSCERYNIIDDYWSMIPDLD